MFFDGKLKAVTFSGEDGVAHDRKLIRILNRYRLRGTFHLNSRLLEHGPGSGGAGPRRIRREEAAEVYARHEIAAHTLTHANLTRLSDAQLIRQVELDRKNLSILAGCEVSGLAYPDGEAGCDDRVLELIHKHTGIRYAQTGGASHDFAMPRDRLAVQPSVYVLELKQLSALAERFVNLRPDGPQVFHIHCHSGEMEAAGVWTEFEEVCRGLSGREDIFYGTSREIYL